MRQRTASALTTRGAVNVAPSDTFWDVVVLLSDDDVTAVPVVREEGSAPGVVSEVNLPRSQARRPEPSCGLTEILPRCARRLDGPGETA
ncbi:CBS domain-containing protein [Streptomyces odontomachi]|uniref:CBS domain-containing protein n=1 Tax=Streptomyces odontomachi TaxID=2944940 RepID=UPI00210AEDA6|nr:CBS domain-containing protein [Streptomyces sp. ODS25]